LTISDCADILGDAHLGDSISVNGMLQGLRRIRKLTKHRNMSDRD
jgi:riboflavin synthase alpha subunit